MKRLFSYLLLFTSYLLLFSCSAEGEYSIWPCRFTYDNSLHLDPTLASAMNIDSRGVLQDLGIEHGWPRATLPEQSGQ